MIKGFKTYHLFPGPAGQTRHSHTITSEYEPLCTLYLDYTWKNLWAGWYTGRGPALGDSQDGVLTWVVPGTPSS